MGVDDDLIPVDNEQASKYKVKNGVSSEEMLSFQVVK